MDIGSSASHSTSDLNFVDNHSTHALNNNDELSDVSYVIRSAVSMPSSSSMFSVNGDAADLPFAVSGFEQQENIAANVYELPSGSRSWIPVVPADVKPYMGSRFRTLDEAIAMYEQYAEAAGFSTRLSTSKVVNGMMTHRYILCSKANKPKDQNVDSNSVCSTSSSRSTSFKVTDCKARIKVKFVAATNDFKIYGFVEEHNHGPISVHSLELSKKRRKLDVSTKEFIANCRVRGLGPTKAHKLHVVLKGGHHNVQGTVTDFKNFGRDIRDFVGDRDAQMVVDKFIERTKNLEDYSFKYEVVGTELTSLFWVDYVSKRNYEAFGEVIAFDATYKTNMYNMIFVPFTGVDNHKKCTVFGAALLHNETIDSYTWLLRKFLEVHGKQPVLVLTDQDPAMKQAVELVFDKSVHRLCMWHILEKIPAKIKGNSLSNKKLRRSIHKLAWNVYIEPSTFERRWTRLITEYRLQNHSWLSELYSIRTQWVPGYFRDIPMCCLMKTTSRCESANHQFKTNSSHHNTLVQFMLCFESILDGQRKEQRDLQHSTETTEPRFVTPLAIERHANEIYTRTVFLEVQKELLKCMLLCYICDREEVIGNIRTYKVAHQDHNKQPVNEFKVTLDVSDHTVTCVCMGFTRVGFLCRHVFCVFRHHNIERIPSKYVHSRWRRDALPSSVHSMANRYCADETKNSVIRRRINDNIQMCTDRLRCNEEKLEELDRQVQEIKDKIFLDLPIDPSYNKNDVLIKDLISHEEPSEVSFTVPKGIRNKGCGKHKRVIGAREKAKKLSKKKKRKCGFCMKLVRGHNIRTCPLKLGKSAEESEETTEDEDDDVDEYNGQETEDEANEEDVDEDL